MGITTFRIVDEELEFANNALTIISGEEALRQRLNNRMQLWAGEWFLEPTVGIDWLDILEAKPPDLVQTEKAIRDELLDEPAVTAVTELTLDFTRPGRRLTITWAVTADLGLVRGEAAIT